MSRSIYAMLGCIIVVVAFVLPRLPVGPVTEAGDEKAPAPREARLTIHLDRETFFLGENVLLHFCVENIGSRPFSVETGGDYRGSSRPTRFNVQAVDEKGRLVADPDPDPICMGGLSSGKELKPGEKYWSTLALMRYRRIEKPGTYHLRVSHDFGWKESDASKFPSARGTITFVEPTAEQARKVVERMYALPLDPSWSYGQKREDYADFKTLLHPAYLPILAPRARLKCDKALTALASMPTPEATRELVRLCAHKDDGFALKAARGLRHRLPDPRLSDKDAYFYNKARHLWLVEHAWRDEFSADARKTGRRLLAKKDNDGFCEGAYLLECLGTNEDTAALALGLDHVAQTVRETRREPNSYPKYSSACSDLLKAGAAMVCRGVPAGAKPRTAGERVLFALAVGQREKDRPRGWEETFAELLRDRSPLVRWVALDSMPLPMPPALRTQLTRLFEEEHIDVQNAACRLAQRSKDRQLLSPVLTVVKTTRDHSLLGTASWTAEMLGGHSDRVKLLIDRLDEPGMTSCCINALQCVLVGVSGCSCPTDHTVEAGRVCKRTWEAFFRMHEAALKTGKKFRAADLGFSLADLFPRYEFYFSKQ